MLYPPCATPEVGSALITCSLTASDARRGCRLAKALPNPRAPSVPLFTTFRWNHCEPLVLHSNPEMRRGAEVIRRVVMLKRVALIGAIAALTIVNPSNSMAQD